jgi:type II secretory pathway pseudopilin PulG
MNVCYTASVGLGNEFTHFSVWADVATSLRNTTSMKHRTAPKQRKTKGFSLIELALIIAIIGILAALTASQFVDLTGSAEKSMLQDFGQKLTSAMSSFVAKNGRFPNSMAEFVADYSQTVNTSSTDTAIANRFIQLPLLQGNVEICSAPTTAASPATASAITCDNAKLVRFTAVYTYQNGGVRTVIKER